MNKSPGQSLFNSKSSPERLAALTDGVIAIAITLLVLTIDIPEDHNFDHEGLMKFLIRLEPGMIAYFSSFLIIAIYWVQHHRIFHVLQSMSKTLLILNIVFLFLISLIPFVTKVKTVYPYDPQIVLIFGLAHILISLILFLTWRNVVNHPDNLKFGLDRKHSRLFGLSILINPVICVLAIAVGFINVHIGSHIFVLIPLVYLFLLRVKPE